MRHEPTPPAADAAPRLSAGDQITVTLDGWAHGGEAVGRIAEGPGAGMACFVAYAIPGETVRAQVVKRKKRWARARLVEVLEASPHRVEPPCPHFGPDRCGGCQLQHIAPDHQRTLKAQVLVEQLQRLGGVEEPPVLGVEAIPGAWPDAYRSWARMAATPDGRLGFRSPGSHQVHPVDECMLLRPEAQALRTSLGDDWRGLKEVGFIAAGDGGMAVLHPGPGGLPTAPAGDNGLALQGAEPAPAVIREPGALHVGVGDVTLRVSAGAFFQASPATALALATGVAEAAAPQPGDVVLDLYAGVGLLSAFLAGDDVTLIAVESDPVAVGDAQVNLAAPAAGTVEVIAADVADALAEIAAADIVVLDPPRSGAGAEICQVIDGLDPRRIVYVACDAAALARDTAVLLEAGWVLKEVRGLDAFGHTAHIEAIATFERGVHGEAGQGQPPAAR